MSISPPRRDYHGGDVSLLVGKGPARTKIWAAAAGRAGTLTRCSRRWAGDRAWPLSGRLGRQRAADRAVAIVDTPFEQRRDRLADLPAPPPGDRGGSPQSGKARCCVCLVSCSAHHTPKEAHSSARHGVGALRSGHRIPARVRLRHPPRLAALSVGWWPSVSLLTAREQFLAANGIDRSPRSPSAEPRSPMVRATAASSATVPGGRRRTSCSRIRAVGGVDHGPRRSRLGFGTRSSCR